jgi:hypothetical protein
MSETTKNPSRAERGGAIARSTFTIVYLGLAVLVFIVYPIAGYMVEHGAFDTWSFFTTEAFGRIYSDLPFFLEL